MANSNFNIGFFSCIHVFVCSLLFFNVDVLFTVSHAATTNNIIPSICSNTSNPQFCTNVLNFGRSKNLKGLATYTLNLARINAGRSLTLTKSLEEEEPNPQLKERYSLCSKNFDEVIGNIENAQKSLAVRDFNGINMATSSVMTIIDECQDNLKLPPTKMSPLLYNGKTLDDICSIILVISNLLPKHM